MTMQAIDINKLILQGWVWPSPPVLPKLHIDGTFDRKRYDNTAYQRAWRALNRERSREIAREAMRRRRARKDL